MRRQHSVPCVGYVVTEKQKRRSLCKALLDPLIQRNNQEFSDVAKWPELKGVPQAVYRVSSGTASFLKHQGAMQDKAVVFEKERGDACCFAANCKAEARRDL